MHLPTLVRQWNSNVNHSTGAQYYVQSNTNEHQLIRCGSAASLAIRMWNEPASDFCSFVSIKCKLLIDCVSLNEIISTWEISGLSSYLKCSRQIRCWHSNVATFFFFVRSPFLRLLPFFGWAVIAHICSHFTIFYCTRMNIRHTTYDMRMCIAHPHCWYTNKLNVYLELVGNRPTIETSAL